MELATLTDMRHAGSINFNPRYPTIGDLREKAAHRIPDFAFDYLDRGCNQEVNLRRNRSDLEAVVLKPKYIGDYPGCDLRTTVFGQEYAAPMGMAPIGLQGMIWPGAPEILARAMFENELPFILSTVSTASLEKIAKITAGKFWFQFYHPADDTVRDDLLDRAWASGCRTLVLLCDTPTFGFRPGEIRNGLSMPPRMVPSNLWQMARRPSWTLGTFKRGMPSFANLRPYMPKRLNLKELGHFMDGFFEKRMTETKMSYIRDRWKGKLVVKGVSTLEDAEAAVRLGMDGIVVSNHGGRQLDAGPSSIASLQEIAPEFGNRITVMMDSGLRNGPDIARAVAHGAQMTFLGRAFMYGVAALGSEGGEHCIHLLKTQLQQTMEQLGCSNPADLPTFRPTN